MTSNALYFTPLNKNYKIRRKLLLFIAKQGGKLYA
ncbi:hypothetical protein BAZSYMB_SCAFFOLD00117_4 [Bathymodiolus azoricus thioautotrophic gill symbiont]|uniref:Uncharacterized protein n=1 Tax=Bathymodiolus azoricus thioautotrophic gill symbiont TaxID=235205 RepID=A0A1H6KPS3_9GAMM|nr:hypothetical protein BAZSYMB_SCAFFOLD00117_4 [Bathymodiolus azoricus thioautotrophic gill symbiont]